MELENHPGCLGLTSRGVVLIHVDWPAYAMTHGWEGALIAFGRFPRATVFVGLDDIDQCVLFVAGDLRRIKDRWSEQLLHIATWHEDVLELSRLGYVRGKTLTAQQWSTSRANELAERMRAYPGGLPSDFVLPSGADYTELEALHGLAIHDGLVVSDSGWDAVERLLFAEREHIAEEILQRIRGVMPLGQYDTAIREACVLIETQMRTAVGSQSYGQALIEEYLPRLRATRRVIPAWLKVIRTEFRALFRFVRNDYMHNLRTISETQCYAILHQASSVYSWVRGTERFLRAPAAGEEATPKDDSRA
jgi:hypothetical protein